MKEITATEAARGFSELLDAVEHRHQSFVVIRGGRAVAKVEPVPALDGAAFKALLVQHRADRIWKQELAELRGMLLEEDHSWPG